MTVASETNRSGPYPGNGVTTVFDYDFRIVSAQHLKVIKSDAQGNETVLTLDADYSVSGVGSADGSIQTVSAPTSQQSILILRAVPFKQETDLENQGAYFAETIEEALDLAAMRDQQLQEQVNRAVKIPPTADASTLDGLISDIVRLADSVDAIDTVSANIDPVVTVSEYIEAVAENLTDVTNFADVYQGPKASNPTTRNDGSALAQGDLYFNTEAKELRVFDGLGWQSASNQSLNLASKTFTGNGAQTAFALNVAPGVAQNVIVFVGGSLQVPGVDYTISGTTLTLDVAPPNGVKVATLVVSATVGTNIPVDGSVTASKLAADVVSGQPAKTSPVDADEFLIGDSEASSAPRRLSLENLIAAIFKVGRTIANAQFSAATFKLFNAAATPRALTFNTTALTADRQITMPDANVDLAKVGLSDIFAWVNFNGQSIPTIRAAKNVTSVTKNTTGDYVVNFATPAPDGNYAVTLTAPPSNGRQPFLYDGNFNSGSATMTTGGFRLAYGAISSGALIDAPLICAIVTR